MFRKYKILNFLGVWQHVNGFKQQIYLKKKANLPFPTQKESGQ